MNDAEFQKLVQQDIVRMVARGRRNDMTKLPPSLDLIAATAGMLTAQDEVEDFARRIAREACRLQREQDKLEVRDPSDLYAIEHAPLAVEEQ